jgi:predicted secreted Zn-dependent protease
MKARLIFLLFAMTACGGVAHAEPAARIGSSFYYIEGASALVLTAQMDNKGPAGPDGRRHPALTKWDVQWRFRHNMLGGVCKMEKVSVMVGVTSIRPRWRGEKEGAAQLRERWGELVKAVDRNVEFHKQQALEAGRKIEAALNGLEPTGDCEALTIAANETALSILEKHKAVSRDYNQRTDYGRKDGLSLI